MAAAMTMQPPSLPLSIFPLSTPPNVSSRYDNGPGPAISQDYVSPEAGLQPSSGQCDGCRRRNSRCAINLAANKCYSCDFHRQDCTFSPNTARKRTYPQSFSAGSKSLHAAKKSLSPKFSELFLPSMVVDEVLYASSQAPCYRYVRGAARPDPVLLENAPLDDNNETPFPSSRFRKVGDGQSEFLEINSSGLMNDGRLKAAHQVLQDVPLKEMDHLVQTFFHSVHPVFPILDPHAFRSAYENRMVDPLLLASVCVLSSSWLATTQNADRTDLSEVEAKTWELLRVALEQPTIPALQAGILLLQGPSQKYHHLASHLMLASFDVGLHLDCSDWTIDDSEKVIRKRLGWVLYAQDKWHSLLFGRPPQLTESNWLVPELSPADFPIISSSQPQLPITAPHGALLFTHLITLSRLLASILDLFYTASSESQLSTSPNALPLVLERAKPVQIRLKEWYSQLPADLRMDAPKTTHVAANGILHLSYFATEIALHRIIITASTRPNTPTYLAHVCRSAAKTRLISAMDLVNRLRPLHFQLNWPLASVANFGLIMSFGSLLRATAPTAEEQTFYEKRLEEYEWTLGVSARVAGWLGWAVGVGRRERELGAYVPGRMGVGEWVRLNPAVGKGLEMNGTALNETGGDIQSKSFRTFSSLSEEDGSSGDEDLDLMEEGGF